MSYEYFLRKNDFVTYASFGKPFLQMATKCKSNCRRRVKEGRRGVVIKTRWERGRRPPALVKKFMFQVICTKGESFLVENHLKNIVSDLKWKNK